MKQYDEKVLQCFQQGCDYTFEAILQQESASILNFIRTQLNEECANDAFQDTWIRIWRNRGNIRDAGKLRPWIFQIARNAIHDHLRKNNKHVSRAISSDSCLAIVDLAPNPRMRYEQSQGEKMLHECLAALDIDARTILRMRYLEELKLREIANRLNVSHSTVINRISRSISKLRRKYHVNVNSI